MLSGHVEYTFGKAELARTNISPHRRRCHVCSNGSVNRVQFCMTVLCQSPPTFRRCKLQKKYEESLESFIYPADAQLDCSKNAKIYIKI
jgi:hypothetical protein